MVYRKFASLLTLFWKLQALQNFFTALVYSANTSFDVLLDSLLSTAKPSAQTGAVAKQALFSIAQCVAVLCLAAGDKKCSSTVSMLTDILKADSSTNSVRKCGLPYIAICSDSEILFISKAAVTSEVSMLDGCFCVHARLAHLIQALL